MDARTQAVLLLALAAISIRLGLSNAALAYIKPGLQPALLAAGIGLALLGGHGLVRALRERTADDGHGDGHAHAPGVAWLLTVPLLALLLIAPPALGSFAVDRQGNAPPASITAGFVELPAPREGAVDLALREFVSRALYDPGQSLGGVRVRLVGFVTPDSDGDSGYRLSRFTVNCCAADATAFTVEVVGDSHRPADNWLEITGRWEPRPGHEPGTLSDEPPLVIAEHVAVIPAPQEPYEY